MINRIMLLALGILRRTLQNKPRFFALLGAPVFQPLLTWIGQVEAWEVYLKASRELPSVSAIPFRSTCARHQTGQGSFPSAGHYQGKLRQKV